MRSSLRRLGFKRRQRATLFARYTGVYRLGDRMMIHAGGMTAEGLGIAIEPAYSCDAGSLPQIGEYVREALAHSRGDIEFPRDKQRFFRPILSAAGVTSWRELHASADHVCVIEDADKLKLLPHKSGGTRGEKKGYEPLPEQAIEIALDSNPELLGEAVMAAFDKCVPNPQ